MSNKKNRAEMRNLLLYASAKTVSVFGTAIYNFAVSFYVLKVTGSALSFAITLMLGSLPMILIMPFAGVIIDKVDKKKLVVTMDLLCGVLMVSVFTASMVYGLSLPLIYATAFLLTVFSTFFGIGIEAAKPNIVSDKMLMNINSISKIIYSVSSILGPALGGMIFAFLDIRMFILINGITFILSGLAILLIDFTFNQTGERGAEEPIQVWQDMREGYSYMSGRQELLWLFLILVFLNFFLTFSVTVPLPYIVNTILGMGSKTFGLIQAAFPMGMILGALVVKKLVERVAYSLIMKILSFVGGIAMMVTGIPVLIDGGPLMNGVFYGGIMFMFGVIVAFIDIPLSYFMQRNIPEEYRGRVMSLGISIGKTMVPVAMILSGMLLDVVPAYALPIGGGLLFLAMNLSAAKKMTFSISISRIEVSRTD